MRDRPASGGSRVRSIKSNSISAIHAISPRKSRPGWFMVPMSIIIRRVYGLRAATPRTRRDYPANEFGFGDSSLAASVESPRVASKAMPAARARDAGIASHKRSKRLAAEAGPLPAGAGYAPNPDRDQSHKTH